MARPTTPHFTSAPPAAELAETQDFALPWQVEDQDLSGVIPPLPGAAGPGAGGDGAPYDPADFQLADLPGQVPADTGQGQLPADVPVTDPGMPGDLPLIPFDTFACSLAQAAEDALADHAPVDFDLDCL